MKLFAYGKYLRRGLFYIIGFASYYSYSYIPLYEIAKNIVQ